MSRQILQDGRAPSHCGVDIRMSEYSWGRLGGGYRRCRWRGGKGKEKDEGQQEERIPTFDFRWRHARHAALICLRFVVDVFAASDLV